MTIEELAARREEMREAGGALSAFSDDALALQFAREQADKLRYVAEWDRWYCWTGTVWRQERTLLAFDLVRDLCRRVARTANDGGRSLASARTVAAVTGLARADRNIVARAGQWDTDGWLLNTPGGTIDLRAGTTYPAKPEDYIKSFKIRRSA